MCANASVSSPSSQVLIYKPTGEHLQTFRPYENALGVKTFAWHPASHLLALGSYDERARLLNSLTWQRIAECAHPSDVRAAFSEEAVVWKEPAEDEPGGYVASRLPCKVASLTPNPDRAEPKVGVGLLAWSHDGAYLVTYGEQHSDQPLAMRRWIPAQAGVAAPLRQPPRKRPAHDRRQRVAVR